VKKWLEDNVPGVVVHNQPMNHVCVGKGRWVSKDNDILNCIDLISMAGGKPLFIQATLDRGVGRKLKKLLEVPWGLEYVDVQVWIKRSPTRISIKELDNNKQLVDKGEIVRRKYVAR
jgi:hypothetical protein